jgi:hypothetical protein
MNGQTPDIIRSQARAAASARWAIRGSRTGQVAVPIQLDCPKDRAIRLPHFLMRGAYRAIHAPQRITLWVHLVVMSYVFLRLACLPTRRHLAKFGRNKIVYRRAKKMLASWRLRLTRRRRGDARLARSGMLGVERIDAIVTRVLRGIALEILPLTCRKWRQ